MRKTLIVTLLIAAVSTTVAAQAPRTDTAGDQSASASDPKESNVDLPVRRVVLFTSGTGFFEHDGTVEGSGTAQLSFTTAQINDVLKSLVVQDADGGTIAGVRYASQEPLAKVLQSFQVDMSGEPGLAALLNQIRGARVNAFASTGKYTGKVLGVEKRELDSVKGGTKPVLNLLTDAGITSVDLNQVSEVTILDGKLRQEMEKALAVLADHRDKDKKPVSVSFEGKGSRRVRLGYVIETPLWKTSYRLVLPAAGTKDAATLQGWAIIENATESDWKDVSLSLVGGRPLSFIEDLYASYYMPRPVVMPKALEGFKPVAHEDGIDVRKLAKDFDKFANPERENNLNASSYFADAGATQPAKEPELPLPPSNEDFTQTVSGGALSTGPAIFVTPPNYLQGVAPLAQVQKIGDTFEFKIDKASLPRQQSAMFPILSEAVTTEQLSVYNEAVLTGNAMHGVILTNTSKSYVRGGPVNVLETSGAGTTYAGDCLVSDLPPGQHRVLSYGVDQELKVLSELKEDSVRTKASIHDGQLVLDNRRIATTTYTLENRSDRDKAVLIEQNRYSPMPPDAEHGWKVTSPVVEEMTEALLRFRARVPAGKSAVLKVVEEGPDEVTDDIDVGLFNGNAWKQLRGTLPPQVLKALEDFQKETQAYWDLVKHKEELEKDRNKMANDENRVRQNLHAVDKNTDYYAKILKRLQDSDDRIEALDKEIEGTQETMAQEAASLKKKAATINVE